MNILLFARHYPPSISGGCRRPSGLAAGLRQAGCTVFVVAPQSPLDGPGIGVDHPQTDPPTRQSQSPTLRDQVREFARLPDPDIAWSRRAAKAAIAATPFKPDWVLTSSPPESLLEAGFLAKRHFAAKWAADFRDSWLERPLRPNRTTAFRRWRERRWAQHRLLRTDLVLAVDELIASEIGRMAPGLCVEVLPQFANVAPPFVPLEDGRIHVVHTGSFTLSDPGRRIEPLLVAFEKAQPRRPALLLHLAGRLSDGESERIAASTAREHIQLHGLLSADEARRLQAAADILLVVAAPGAAAIPGKVFEYFAAGRPIAAIGDGPWRAACGLERHDAEAIFLGEIQPPPTAGVTTPEQAARTLLRFLTA